MSRLHTTNLGSLVSVNGIQVPKGCSTLSITYQDTSDSDSGRSSLTGSMWKGYIGTLRTLKCAWNSLYPDHIREILQAVKGLNRFPVQFFDPESGEYVTSDFYVGDRSTDIKTFFRNHELIGLNLTLIENDPYADGNGDTGGGGGGIVPEGTITITNNGLHEVTMYEMADVKVPPYGEGEVQIKTNGRHSVSGKAVAVVNVPAGGGGITPSGTIEIDSNGKHDVTDYAEADVQVPPYGIGETIISSNGDHDVSGKATAKVNVPPYGVGEIEIHDNGRIDVSGKATAVVNVPKGINPEGVIEITENGDHDVTQYATARVSVSGGGSADPFTAEAVYKATRPAEWMPMPNAADEEDAIYMLVVCPDVAYIAFTATSADGSEIPVSIGTVDESGTYTAKADLSPAASGSKAQYAIDLRTYDWAPSDNIGDKQAMIKISANVKKFDIQSHTSVSPSFDSYPGDVVDIEILSHALTSLSLSNMSGLKYAYVDVYDSPDVCTDMHQCFYDCGSLLCVRKFRCAADGEASAIFRSCGRLQAVDLTGFVAENAQRLQSMFMSCGALTNIDISGVSSTTRLTDASSLFYYCYTLRSVRLSGLDVSKITTMSNMFSSCECLEECDLSTWDISSVKTATSLFNNCYRLRRLILNPDMTGWAGVDIDLTYSKAMTTEAIRDLITSLPTITASHTIKLTGVLGAADLTDDDVAAAAAKNWTLVYTGASTTSDEPDIPDAQALAIITGEEV